MEQDTFWDDYPIPFNDEDERFEFANPIDIQEDFVRMVGIASYMGNEVEKLTKQMADLNVEKAEEVRRLNALRREILANHYGEIKVSASPEVKDAFILLKAREEGREQELLAIEEEINKRDRQLEVLEPALEMYRFRLSMLTKKGEWARQYLDYNKLDRRLEEGVNRAL